MKGVAATLMILAGLAIGASAALAGGAAADQTPPSPPSQAARSCPDLSKLRNICGFVDTQFLDAGNPKYYNYRFEHQVYDAACVQLGIDTPAIARVKIRTMWREHPEAFRCNSINFDMSNGSILKYAASVQNRNFLEKVTRSWKVVLNMIGPEDGMTVLDYVQVHLQHYKGTPGERILEDYFQMLREAGAKFRSELPQ